MEFYAKIDEPRKLRINFMLAARESIIAFSRLEQLEEIRRRKVNLIGAMKEDFRDAAVACKALSELVSDEKTRKTILEAYKALKAQEAKELAPKPAVKAPLKPVKVKHAVLAEKAIEEPLQIEVKKKTDMDRLEYTLNMIEQKLSELQKEET
jgi:hypothetical protein